MKKITSLTLAFSFLIMSYTGVMLFIVPQGKVAYWSDWHLFGLSKSQYGELHTTSMVTFLLFALLHIYYNWKPLMGYIKDKNRKISFTKKEFLIAFLLNIVFIVGTLYLVQPFKAFLDFEDGIKDMWAKKYGEPPYGHAEETKLNVLCKKLNIDLEKAKLILQKNNINFKESEPLKDIAKNNALAPSDIYKLIRNDDNNTKTEDIPSSLGRRTLKELSEMGKIDLKHAISVLKTKGLTEVPTDNKIKNISDELELMPLDVYNIIK